MNHKPINTSAVPDQQRPPDPTARTQAQSASPPAECGQDLSRDMAAFIERLAHLVAGTGTRLAPRCPLWYDIEFDEVPIFVEVLWKRQEGKGRVAR